MRRPNHLAWGLGLVALAVLTVLGLATPVAASPILFQVVHSDTSFRSDTSDGTVPEPASLVLLGSGLVGLAGLAWRRRPRK